MIRDREVFRRICHPRSAGRLQRLQVPPMSHSAPACQDVGQGFSPCGRRDCEQCRSHCEELRHEGFRLIAVLASVRNHPPMRRGQVGSARMSGLLLAAGRASCLCLARRRAHHRNRMRHNTDAAAAHGSCCAGVGAWCGSPCVLAPPCWPFPPDGPRGVAGRGRGPGVPCRAPRPGAAIACGCPRE
jgi:hypothetical protein